MSRVEADLSEAQARRDVLDARLAETADHPELAELGSALAEATRELEEIEERWLELAAEAEAGAAGSES